MNIFIDDSSAVAQPIQYGTFTGPNSVTTQDVTAPGYTPSLVLLFSNQRNAAGTDANGNQAFNLGVAIPGGNKWTACAMSPDATGSNKARLFRSDYAFGNINTSAAQSGYIDTLTSITGGFRVNWAVASNTIVHYIAFPPALTAYVSTLDTGTSTGTQDITAPGFQPVATLFASTIPNTTEGTSTTFTFGFGAGVSSTSRAAMSGYVVNISGNQAQSQVSNSNALVKTAAAGTNNLAIDYEGTVSGGFRIDMTTAPASSSRVGYACLAGSGLSAHAGVFTSKTSTGTQAYTGVGFQPTAILFFGRGSTALDSLVTGNLMVMGGATVSAQGSSGSGTVSSTTSNTAAYLSTTQAVGAIGGASSSPDQIATLTSFDSDGFTLDWTTANGSATYYGYIAFRYA